jgi:hypothetical protein
MVKHGTTAYLSPSVFAPSPVSSHEAEGVHVALICSIIGTVKSFSFLSVARVRTVMSAIYTISIQSFSQGIKLTSSHRLVYGSLDGAYTDTCL